MDKTPFLKWLACVLLLVNLVFATSLVHAFELSDLFDGKSKKKTVFACVDLSELRKNLKVYKQYDDQLKALDEEYAEYSESVLSEQKKAAADLMAQYQAKALGLDEFYRAELLNEYKDKASRLARESQRNLDAKKAELDGKRKEIERKVRAMTRRLVRDVAKKKGVAFVVEKSMSVYVKNDITQDVLNAVEKQERKKFLGIF